MKDDNLHRFELDEKQHQLWFEEVVLPYFAADKRPADVPTFVLLTGQPGAGKTFSSLKYAERLDAEPIRFGADDLRLMLPYAMDAIREDEANYPFLTKRDSGLAREKLVDYAIAHGNNILIESILAKPDDWQVGTVLKAKNAGYRIECVALGVHRHVSMVSMFTRFEDQKAISGYGFAPTLDVHNRAYTLLPELAGKMMENGVADALRVYNRSFKCFYDSDNDPHSSLEIMKAVNRSRNSSLNYNEMCNVAIKWDLVQESMQKRGADEESFEQVRRLSTDFKKSTMIYFTQPYCLKGKMENKEK